MRKTGEEQGVRWLQIMTSVLLGGVLSLAVCLIVLLLCSIGISNGSPMSPSPIIRTFLFLSSIFQYLISAPSAAISEKKAG